MKYCADLPLCLNVFLKLTYLSIHPYIYFKQQVYENNKNKDGERPNNEVLCHLYAAVYTGSYRVGHKWHPCSI